MKVSVCIMYQGEKYNWNELSEIKKKEISEKLNDQAASALGYKRKAPKKVPVI